MKEQIDRLIDLYCRGVIDDRGIAELYGWISRSDANRSYFVDRCRSFFPGADDHMARPAWSRFEKERMAERRVPGRRYRLALRYGSIAAVLALGVWASVFFSGQRSRTQISESYGPYRDITNSINIEKRYRTAGKSTMNLTLEDGSRITLNAGAELAVAPDFNTGSRTVALVGEAFFDVEPDENLPFVVESGEATFTVLGTSFNILSYPADKFMVVTLHTGRLSTKVGADIITLEPGNELVIDTRAHTLSKRMVNVSNSVGWLSGRIIFDALPLREVVRKLERKYDIRIEVDDRIAGLQFTGAIDDESLDEVFRLLKETSLVGLDVKRAEGEYRISKRRN